MPSFPASVYSRPDPIPALMSDTPTHSTILGQYGDELEAIEGTLGVNPQGSDATVAARLTRTGVTVHKDSVALTKPKEECGSTSGTLDGSGDLTITFASAFAAAPFIIATNGEPANPVTCTAHSPTTTTMKVRFRLDTDGTVTSGVHRAQWHAIGNAP